MRVYGQGLESTKLAEPSEPQGHSGGVRSAARPDQPRGDSDRDAGIVNLSDAATKQSRKEWLRGFETFSQIELAFDEQDKVLWCFMNPPGRPSVTLELARESRILQRSLQQLFHARLPGAAAPVRYMVWSSRRPGIFNLGGDLRLFAELIRQSDRERLLEYATACVDVVYANATNLDLPIITVSLVRGDALGGGFEAAISSSLVIAERGAKFGLPEMLFNLFPGMGAYSLIARRIGAAQAERMILSGRIYGAEALYEMGLIDVLADEGKGEDAVFEYIEQYGRRHSAHRAIYDVRHRVNPLTHGELLDIARLWVKAALELEEGDLRRMERLAAAQDRRIMAPARGG